MGANIFYNSRIEISFTFLTIHPLQVYNVVLFSESRVVQPSAQWISKHFITQKENFKKKHFMSITPLPPA